jgi:hypothetical protein
MPVRASRQYLHGMEIIRLAQTCRLALLIMKNALPLLFRNNAGPGPRKGLRGFSLMIRSAEPLGLVELPHHPSHARR